MREAFLLYITEVKFETSFGVNAPNYLSLQKYVIYIIGTLLYGENFTILYIHLYWFNCKQHAYIALIYLRRHFKKLGLITYVTIFL